MVFNIPGPLNGLDTGRAVAGFFSRTGISRLARRWRPSDACVLTFHGVRQSPEEDASILDPQQHMSARLLEDVCGYLAEHYAVLSLSEIVAARKKGQSLPRRTVAITFDDGWASNFRLALPLLKARGIPATVFIATGFVDGRISMWFQRLELALLATTAERLDVTLGNSSFAFSLTNRPERKTALSKLTAHLKTVPAADVPAHLIAIESGLGLTPEAPLPTPAPLQPMTWDMVREMQASGLVEFGAHTDTHPVLARCSEEHQEQEIRVCRERMADELGTPPELFAYPNGKTGDYTATTQRLLAKHGFTDAFTMQETFLLPDRDPLNQARYGCPASCSYLEAVVSGSMARYRSLRENLGLVRTR